MQHSCICCLKLNLLATHAKYLIIKDIEYIGGAVQIARVRTLLAGILQAM